MKKLNLITLVIFLIASTFTVFAQEKTKVASTNYNALELRNVSTGFASGRIADIAIHPENENVWYVAVGSGGVWKTENASITWKPIFDNQSSYSIGSIAIDPSTPSTVWVGTGENVGGRHVGFGDGIYKSTDDGNSWKNMGLKESEHISTIIIHPTNSDIVWVAAQGPLWKKGGERGLYMTEDGGETWTKTLGDEEWTGVTDIVIDPRDPNVLYAATWQRHRTVAAYLGGGPGSGLHKSTDGGKTWMELKNGIPGSNLGKIGLAISPQNPDIVYAAIELDHTKGGLFMTENNGASWKKMSDMVSGGTGPHYYQELYVSPHHFGRLYLMNVRTIVSNDHGRTYQTISERNKHSDNHALAFRSDDPDYLLMGSDGGIYESYDHGDNWRYIPNLPLTQYYKVAVDNEKPFYNMYGGTQDNGTHEGPSRTDLNEGIRNADWKHILFADGHDTATEPGNPDIVYGETQQGGLHRIDRKTGEVIYIQPQASEGEE
ncbi:MAG TPA: glycosyl hydrolase, partial [Balneola sp.]|nr:glycosyl hydrolase [Balneola sp.]